MSNSNKSLIAYLQNVVSLEQTKYENELILSEIDKKIRYYSNPPLTPLKEASPPPANSAPLAALFFGIGATVLLILSLWIIGGTNGDDGILDFFFNTIPVFIARALVILIYICAIVSLIKMAIEDTEINASLHKEYDSLLVYNRHAQDSNKRKIKQYNEILSKYKNDKCVFQYNLRNAEKVLEEYYSLNIIHKDYRGLVPVTSIYQYLDRRVCTELEGHEGAYNKYDNELLHRIIIGKLDDVLQNLEKIKHYQKMLYELLRHSHNCVSNLMSRISSNEKMLTTINEQNVRIAGHLSAIEYTNSKTAMNTSIVADLEIFRFLTKR